jgi:hypothetical protein
MKKKDSEKIVKVWRLVYMKLFNEIGYIVLNKCENFCDKNGDYGCTKLFWRFYWINELQTYK